MENDKLEEFSARINKLSEESRQKSADFAKKVEAANLKDDTFTNQADIDKMKALQKE